MSKGTEKLEVRLGNLALPVRVLEKLLAKEGKSLADWTREKVEEELRARGITFKSYRDGRFRDL